MPSPNVSGLSAQRAGAYIFRLPPFTRAVILIIAVAWVLSLQSIWNVRDWGALVPDKMNLQSVYRTNTYTFIHLGFFHAFTNVLALTPLLERFEREYGTLASLALFFGPFATFPALLYVGVENFIFRMNHTVMGASIWVFLLMAIEAIRVYKTNPSLILGPLNIPTWTIPILLAVVISALVPGTSLLGHLCGLLMGYLYGLGYILFLVPSERVLRWIEVKLKLAARLPQYVSVDQKTYGRFGILPQTAGSTGLIGSTQRLGTA